MSCNFFISLVATIAFSACGLGRGSMKRLGSLPKLAKNGETLVVSDTLLLSASCAHGNSEVQLSCA